MALPAPGPPAQLGLDVPYRSPAIFVPTASNLGAAIICPNSSTASLVQPQRPPASSTQLLYRRRSPPYLLQRHTPLLLRPAPASLAPLPLRRRSRDRLPSSGMWPCQRQDRLLSWASMCRTDRLQSSSRRPATSALQSSAPIAVPCLVQPQRPPASSTQLLYRRRIPPYLLQRHTPLLLRPAPASLAPLPLRRRSRDRLPSSGMWPCQRQDRLLSWASMCRTDRLQSSSRRPATSVFGQLCRCPRAIICPNSSTVPRL